jgi:hypothetical protein
MFKASAYFVLWKSANSEWWEREGCRVVNGRVSR